MLTGLSRCAAAAAAVVVAAVGVGGYPAAAESFAEGAERFIRKMADEAITSLTVNDISAGERADRFHDIMTRYIAFKGVARWVVGRKHWRKATKEQQAEYLGLFEDLMVESYAHRFKDYSGETPEVQRTQVYDGKDAVVFTKMIRPGATQPLDVSWRVRAKDGKYKVVDIMVEGLSMAKKQRSEFNSFLRQNDGDIGLLLKELRMRIEDARKRRDE